jgi:hypothetical protein
MFVMQTVFLMLASYLENAVSTEVLHEFVADAPRTRV